MPLNSESVTSSHVDIAIAEWFEAMKADAALDRSEFINRYPLIRSELLRFFENYDSVHDRLSGTTGGSRTSNEPVPANPASDPAPVPSMVTAVSLGEKSSVIADVTTNARYRELKQFNKGGLGDLYRAHDESLHRETAIKMVNDRAASEPSLLDQFRVEAEITGRLDHPGVVPVYGFGEDWGGRPFYVMRLIKGEELAKAIRDYHESCKDRWNSPDARRKLMTLLEHLISACKTIAYAHDVGIIHCDIKPANIMVGRYGETFVLDWGLASTFERTKTFMVNEPNMLRPKSSGESSTNGPRGGTYGYISPEQLSTDQPITPVSDVYSLGATLYEILTGTAPFDGHDADVREKICAGEFAAPHQVLRMVPRRLEAICLKALSLTPSNRYSTAKLLAQDLTSWMRDDELLVMPDQWFHRVSRQARRHRGIVITISVAAIMIIAAIGWTIFEAEKHRYLAGLEAEKTAHEVEKRKYIEEQSTIVEKSLDTSLKTLEDVCRPVANGEMHNLTVLLPVMNKINDFATDYLEKHEKIPSMQVHTGRVYELRATVSRVLASDTALVLKYYKQAETVYDEQIRENKVAADLHDLPRRLIDVWLNQSLVHIQRDEYDAAESILHQSKSSTKSLLHDRYPNDPDLERNLAEIFHLLGQVNLSRETDGQKYTKALLDAEGFFEDSLYGLTKLLKTAEGAEKRDLLRDLARSYGYLGDVYLAQGLISKAERKYEDSDEKRKELYDSDRFDAENRFQYARGRGNFGYLERNYRGDLKRAAEFLEETNGLQSSLIKDFPAVTTFSSELAYTQNCLAEVYLWQAIDHPEQKADYLIKASDAAKSAQQHLQNDPLSKHGLAWSLTTQAAIAMLTDDENEARQLAKRSEDLMVSGRDGAKMSRSEKVTLAIAASMQGKTKVAYEALSEAVHSGENTPVRFEKHRSAGLKALAEDPIYGHQFQELCQRVRGDIREK